LDIGDGILAIGDRILDIGDGILAMGYWIMVIGERKERHATNK
jgi:hypothetical protein